MAGTDALAQEIIHTTNNFIERHVRAEAAEHKITALLMLLDLQQYLNPERVMSQEAEESLQVWVEEHQAAIDGARVAMRDGHGLPRGSAADRLPMFEACASDGWGRLAITTPGEQQI